MAGRGRACGLTTVQCGATRNKILLINAVNEVTRERAQSFLTDDHLKRIVDAYRAFEDVPGFAHVATTDEVLERSGNLSIPLYVRSENGNASRNGSGDDLRQAIVEWQTSSKALRDSMGELFTVLGEVGAREERTEGGEVAE